MSLNAELLKTLEYMIFGSQRVTREKLNYVSLNNPIFLVAFDEDQPIGFKLGYVIPDSSVFFSWLGGVHANYRRQGIANDLLKIQEKSAQESGMEIIYFTTYDRFPAMISLGEKNNYQLAKSEEDQGEMKYWYEKVLLNA